MQMSNKMNNVFKNNCLLKTALPTNFQNWMIEYGTIVNIN